MASPRRVRPIRPSTRRDIRRVAIIFILTQVGVGSARIPFTPKAMTTAPLDVLVVDDSVDLTATLADMLQLAGYRVRRAHSRTEALEQIAAAKPDVLVTDVFMSDGNGIELIATVRELHPHLRCVTMSGGGGVFCRLKDCEARALAAGAAVHLTKPFGMREIISAVVAPPAATTACVA